MKILAIIILQLHLSNSLTQQVQLKYGLLRGSAEKVNGIQVNRFLGIPYAEPPLGVHRFKKTQPYSGHWENPLDATKWPNVCHQPIVSTMARTFMGNMSEDCLHLNIWTKPSGEEANEENLKPVLVFLHGGAFFMGSGSSAALDGAKLAARSDIVVVTLNYRLGPLGFLYAHEEGAPGNAGLWDQVIALEWIQDNIRYFGGDPKRVTVSGTSAGGMSIGMHILSPLNSKLFQRAIIVSGPIINQLPACSKSYALAKTLLLATAVGCRKGEDVNLLSEAELDCLRNLDPNLLSASQFAKSVTGQGSSADFWPFRPIYGDKLEPTAPTEALKSGKFKQNISIMIGTVKNEGVTYDVLMDLLETKDSPQDKRSWFTYTAGAMDNVDIGLHKLPDYAIESLFYSAVGDSEYAKGAHHDAMGSVFLHCPTNFMARHLARANEVYQYVFEAPAKMSVFCKNQDETPCHADDVLFTFANHLQDADDVHISKQWTNLLADFIKGKELPMPKYIFDGNHILAPYYSFRGHNMSTVGYGFKYYSCMFWEEVSRTHSLL